jgi:hypothetical protein
MASTDKPKSVLVGFSVCPLCGGKTHVKRIDLDGKKPYSHCLDEHDQGCSHTLYTYNAQQAGLLMAKTRPVPGQVVAPTVASPIPTGGEGAPPTATATPAEDTTTKPAKPARRGLFSFA